MLRDEFVSNLIPGWLQDAGGRLLYGRCTVHGQVRQHIASWASERETSEWRERRRCRKVVLARRATQMTNLIYNCYLSDMETGYEVPPRTLALGLDLKARGFELEPEITSKPPRLGQRVYEVPIRSSARPRGEGNRLSAMDWFRALATLVHYRRWSPR